LGPYCLSDRLGSKLGRLDERYEFWKWTLNNCGCQTSRGYTLGPCGLCALPRLAQIGVASLKVVGREASLARKVASVELAAVALGLSERGAAPGDIRDAVVTRRGAPELCKDAHLCYYPDVWAETSPPRKDLVSASPRVFAPRNDMPGPPETAKTMRGAALDSDGRTLPHGGNGPC
jgi:hypothetical protein